MATLHRVRVVAVGSEKDMGRLCRVLLTNCDWLPPEDERPEFTVSELKDLIEDYIKVNGTPFDTFSYEMIAPMRFGDAEPGTCRLTIREENCGLWTACFSYDSQSVFQIHEWLDLHERCGRMLMVAQRASWDFGLDKGEIILTGGETLDDWNGMNECWLWLIPQYECGYPPEEAVKRLEKLSMTMEREECDMSISELLRSCMDNLNAIAMEVEDPEAVKASMRACVERRDFAGLLEMQHMVAESVLWETEHNAKWLACLETVLNAWKEYSGETDEADPE